MKRAVYLVNLVLVAGIVTFQIRSKSPDKTGAIAAILFLILVTVNLILGILAKLDRSPHHRIFFRSAIYLILGISLYIFLFVVLPPFPPFF